MVGRRRLVTDGLPSMLRHRRRGLLLAVGLILPFHPLDLLLKQASRRSLAFELLWIIVLAAAALLQSTRTPRLAVVAARLAGLATGLLFSLIAGATGGSGSPYFFYSLAIPSSALVLLPGLPSVAALTTLGTLGGGIALLLREGKSWGYVAAWSYLGLAACLLTGIGAWLYLRMSQAEARAERARADAEQSRAAGVLAMAELERSREQAIAAAHAEATRSRDNLRKILENDRSRAAGQTRTRSGS